MKFSTAKAFSYLSGILLLLVAIEDRKVGRHLGIYLVIAILLFGYRKVIVPRIEEKLCIERVKTLILKHATALSIQRNRLVTTDIYGNVHDEPWKKEIRNFLENTIIKKQLTEWEKESLEYQKPYDKIVAFVEKVATEKSIYFSETIAYSESLSGREYEALCRGILVKQGWHVETTKVVGDQGVDLIATKGNDKVAIQCKKYSSSIGNWAVQEIVAGKDYYKSHYGVVVSNAPYTRSAKELAQVHGIRLLHHNDLLEESFFMNNEQ